MNAYLGNLEIMSHIITGNNPNLSMIEKNLCTSHPETAGVTECHDINFIVIRSSHTE